MLYKLPLSILKMTIIVLHTVLITDNRHKDKLELASSVIFTKSNSLCINRIHRELCIVETIKNTLTREAGATHTSKRGQEKI